MRIRVLGSAAGGGFPQWNCGCTNCADLRAGATELAPRSQDSLAVSADGRRWLLLNASPDVRTQVAAFPGLWPRAARDTPIAAVALTNGDLDHVLGLFSLREAQRLLLFATSVVRRGLVEHNAVLRTLQRFEGQSRWLDLELGRSLAVTDGRGEPLGLSIEAVAAPGKPPLHLMSTIAASELDNIGLLVRDEATGGTLAYFSSVAGPSRGVAEALARADVCFFDGTFWSSDELALQGLGSARAEAMAHWPLSGPDGSLAWLSRQAPRRCFLTHVNNSNPILRDGSAERLLIERAGLELAWDGLELES